MWLQDFGSLFSDVLTNSSSEINWLQYLITWARPCTNNVCIIALMIPDKALSSWHCLVWGGFYPPPLIQSAPTCHMTTSEDDRPRCRCAGRYYAKMLSPGIKCLSEDILIPPLLKPKTKCVINRWGNDTLITHIFPNLDKELLKVRSRREFMESLADGLETFNFLMCQNLTGERKNRKAGMRRHLF